MNKPETIKPLGEADRARVGEIISRIDEVAGKPQLSPPPLGCSQRQAIASITDDLTGAVCAKIGEMRRELDALEQRMLTDAAEAKGKLNDLVVVCTRTSDAVLHMRQEVEDMRRA